MNREEKFINYLEGLKTDGNAELLEGITTGFKTLVEYRIGGSPAEKMVDIMESEDDILDDVEADVEADVPLDESEGEGGSSEESNAVEPVLEVGEGEVKTQLTPGIMKAVDAAVILKISKISQMIDQQKLVDSPEQKQKYLDSMRSNLWRDMLLEKGINPAQAKGLIPSMNESIEEANTKLLDFVDTAFKIFSIDRHE